MARSYARVLTAIWRDDRFLLLSSSGQRLYLLLITQPDISAAGTLPLRARRWAALARDTDGQAVAAGLQELTAAGLVLADTTSEELLVTAFVRWDGGFSNRKRLPVILEAAREVSSLTLRRHLREEFQRLGLPTSGLEDAQGDSLSRAPSPAADPEGSGDESDTSFAQVDRLSDAPSYGVSRGVSPSERVVVGYVRTPQPTTSNPHTTPTPSGREAPQDSQTIIAMWIESCRKRPPKNVIGQVSRHIKIMLEEGIDPDDVQAGLSEWAMRGNLHPATLPSLVNEMMNSDHARGADRERSPGMKRHSQKIARLDQLKTGRRNLGWGA